MGAGEASSVEILILASQFLLLSSRNPQGLVIWGLCYNPPAPPLNFLLGHYG